LVFLTITLICFIVGIIGFIIGGGFGTILTPILVLLGFDITDAIFTVLFAQFFGEVVVTILHHRVGNANFSYCSQDTKYGLLFGICGVSSILGVFLALSVNKEFLILYNVAVLLFLGTLVLISRFSSKRMLASKKVLLVGAIAAINKALTGGNYGPTILVGSLLLGGNVKKIVAIISLAETITCGVALVGYFLGGVVVDGQILFFAVLGTLLASTPSVFLVRKIPRERLRRLIGILMILLGLMLLIGRGLI